MVGDVIRAFLVLIALIGVVWLVVGTVGYNVEQNDTCKEHGLVMVKGYFEGGYGCAEITRFDELEN